MVPSPFAHQLSFLITRRKFQKVELLNTYSDSSRTFQRGPSHLNLTLREPAQTHPRVLPRPPLPLSRYIRGPQRLQHQFLYRRRPSAHLLLSWTSRRTHRANTPYWKPTLLLGCLPEYSPITLALGIICCHLL